MFAEGTSSPRFYLPTHYYLAPGHAFSLSLHFLCVLVAVLCCVIVVDADDAKLKAFDCLPECSFVCRWAEECVCVHGALMDCCIFISAAQCIT